MLRTSEMSSYNNLNETRVKSLLSDMARQHFEYINSVPMDDLQGAQSISNGQPNNTASDDLNMKQGHDSPWFKHMPAGLYKNIRHKKIGLQNVPNKTYLDSIEGNNNMAKHHEMDSSMFAV